MSSISKSDLEIMRNSELAPEVQFTRAAGFIEEGIKSGAIQPLTSQQKHVITLMRMGLPPESAARGAGMPRLKLEEFRKTQQYELALGYIMARDTAKIEVTKDTLTFQYYEAIARADTAGEAIRGLDSVAKLHEIGGFARQQGVSVTISQGAEGEGKEANIKRKMERMSDEELMKRAGRDIDLEPVSVRYDDDDNDNDNSD